MQRIEVGLGILKLARTLKYCRHSNNNMSDQVRSFHKFYMFGVTNFRDFFFLLLLCSIIIIAVYYRDVCF